MCGIVGYIGEQDATPIILNGLKKLEYRGYDSAGIAVLQDGHIQRRRDAGKLNHLIELVAAEPLHGKVGIGHTRWATHGVPNARNAHPHIGSSGEVVVVHNGIVENYLELREDLTAEGVIFNSDTDTETIVHLVERFLSTEVGLAEAVRLTLKQLKGAHGVVVMSSREPDKIVAARVGNARWRWSAGKRSACRRWMGSQSTPRSIPWPGIRSRLKRANTDTSCRRRSTSRCAR
jgi:glucosamine--fructose-6-phosphate aminotransferase (isomerizing)